ncbi:MAG: dephospho-CoA kinase [Clostridiales bacterium]|nr:dephospho-CoA kinase [Clostridiales bacterium]
MLYIVGLTGPTGAGKSAVAAVLQEHGFPVADADRLARRAVEPGMPSLIRLAEVFGEDILLPNGCLDRKRLAARAFSTQEQTKRLNAIVHPSVIALSKEQLSQWEQEGKRAAVIDAPLLFESGMDSLCLHTVAVLAPREIRKRRVCERDGLTVEQAEKRMSVQPDDSYYESRADEILRNEGDTAALRAASVVLAVQIRRAAYGE